MQAKYLLPALFACLLLVANPHNSYAASNNNYDLGVGYYRDGQFDKAEKVFTDLNHDEPNNISALYYLGITEVQLGHLELARTYYNQVLQLASPESDLAKLAAQGLAYLPAVTQHIDAPPKPTQSQAYGAPTQQTLPQNNDTANLPGYPQQLPGVNAGQQASQNSAAATAASSMFDPKMMDMMMMMSAMGGGGGSNNNSFMMIPMMQEMMQRSKNGGQASPDSQDSVFNPQMMQQMLMQNMMPNVDNLFTRDKDN